MNNETIEKALGLRRLIKDIKTEIGMLGEFGGPLPKLTDTNGNRLSSLTIDCRESLHILAEVDLKKKLVSAEKEMESL